MLQHKIDKTDVQNIAPFFEEATILGSLILDEPVLIDLINSEAMQRLKLIHQYGVAHYPNKNIAYSRYQHSLGVLHILKVVGCSLQEQIAGLLHDVSHTVFSHVADVLFAHKSSVNSYQDDIHEWYISKTDIPAILSKYGFCVKDILHKSGTFKALEQDLPDLCADRLEYLLNGAFLEQLLTAQQVQDIFASLCFNNQTWYFSSLEQARKLADISLHLTEFRFASAWNIASYYWAAQALRLALDSQLLTLDDIHFSSDDAVWNKLAAVHIDNIDLLLKKIENSMQYCALSDASTFDLYVKPKLRGIDPLVMVDSQLVRLSVLDQDFYNKFWCLKNKLENGLYLKLN